MKPNIILPIGLPACCDRPIVLNMDYTSGGEGFVNRHCNRCHTHWYGPASDPKRYTRKEWDDLLAGEPHP